MKTSLRPAVIALVAVATQVPAADPNPKVAELSQWVMTYYQHPEPERFVGRVREMAQAGMLHSNRPDTNVMFLGKVMEKNPAKIAAWLDALADLPASDITVLQRAAWYSQTAEGKGWLEAHGQAELVKARPPLLGDGPMAFEPYHLDMLWEWFFATGDAKPVRSIVSYFNLAPSEPKAGSSELPRPPEDKNNAVAMGNFRIARPAVWSSIGLAIEHDRVFEILQQIDTDPALKPMQKMWVGQALKVAGEERAKRGRK